MKKSYLATVFFLAAMLLCGCPSSQTDAQEEMIDLHSDIDWKAPDPAVSQRPKILFVGNSHTFYNHLSRIFVNIVDAMGRKSDVYELSQGYYTLKRFSDTEDKAGIMLDQVLSKQKWELVVLQENTSMVLSPSPEEEMYPYARALDEKIKAAGGQTAFLMTWAPKNGIKDGIRKKSMEDTQMQIAARYMAISDELDSLVIPAGAGFVRCQEAYPEIELWDNDGQHPSPEGSYLTACVIYATIFRESPENCSYTGDLDKETAAKLQKVAAELILH